MEDFDATYYSETLNKELRLNITFVDACPETNYYMFDFEALEGQTDFSTSLSGKEWEDCEYIILKYLKSL